ncbi:MAG: hypothetical protein ACPHRO_05395, partial [Nannocystaceae bacterium]
MLRSFTARPLLCSLMLCLATVPACKKSTTGTVAPEAGAAEKDGNSVTLRYPVGGVTLTASGAVSMELASPGGAGTMALKGDAEF